MWWVWYGYYGNGLLWWCNDVVEFGNGWFELVFLIVLKLGLGLLLIVMLEWCLVCWSLLVLGEYNVLYFLYIY